MCSALFSTEEKNCINIGSKDIFLSVMSSIRKIGIPFPCKSHHTDLFDHETKVWLNATF